MLKVIVTQRIDYIREYDETRDSIDQKLLEWLLTAGLLPIPVSNKLIASNKNYNQKSPLLSWLLSIKPDALVLSGGNDIGQYLDRDKTELFLLDWAKKNKLPVLGICRGMQMMSIYSGCNLIKVSGHVNSRHKLTFKNTEIDLPREVNSFHEFAINECPEEYKILANSEDGIIEAIQHDDLPWEGWMWHPEREKNFSLRNLKHFKKLFIN